jgi:regulator of protease activity HflC (stomatin/prohibitin superfamily)
MAILRKEFKEQKEFSPFIWEVRKRVFAQQRYLINGFILIIAAGLFLLDIRPTWLKLAGVIIIAALGLSVRIAFEWERVPVLRFGRYIKTRGPGLFFLIPFVDTSCGFVDCRITVTDFGAEKVLTKDAVPLYVDAIIFWMIWDAAKARLEVENYRNAVPLSAKTALRDIIGKTPLARILTDRDEIGQELQKILDAKTNPWGITALSVEIKDIVVPEDLEDAISKEAQAEREKHARVILGSVEVELSEQYAKAAEKYKNNEEALTLRSLNLLLDAVKSKGSMILVPSEVPNAMNKALSAAIAKKSAEENA